MPLYHPHLKAEEATGQYKLLRGLREFREHLGGELTITLLAGSGRGVEMHAMDEGLIVRAIDWLGDSIS